MEYVLGTKDRDGLEYLTKAVRSRGMRGYNGTWDEFIKKRFPKFGPKMYDPWVHGKPTLIDFLMTFTKKEDLRLITTWFSSPGPILACLFSRESADDTHLQKLVRLTHTRDDHPLDYFLSPLYNAEDWVVTGFGKNKYKTLNHTKADMIAVCCEKVLCEDGSEAVVRVAAVDRDLQVILDEFLKPNQPVSDYRTIITGLTAQDLETVTTVSAAAIQEKLRKLLNLDTIMVGHFLNQDLNALKMDHARKIDTSLVFNYKYSGKSNPPRPPFDYLCKSVLGYEVQKAPHKAEAAMKLVLAIVDDGVETSFPLTDELLKALTEEEENASSKLLKALTKEEENASAKKQKSGKNASSKKRKSGRNVSSKKQKRRNVSFIEEQRLS